MHVTVPVAFLGGSIGPGEVVLLFLVILVLFGPRRLPDMARQVGKMMNELRRASQDFRDQVVQIDREMPPAPPAGTNTPDALGPAAPAADKPATPTEGMPADRGPAAPDALPGRAGAQSSVAIRPPSNGVATPRTSGASASSSPDGGQPSPERDGPSPSPSHHSLEQPVPAPEAGDAADVKPGEKGKHDVAG